MIRQFLEAKNTRLSELSLQKIIQIELQKPQR